MMNLKEPDKRRVDFEDIQWGDYDHDGSCLAMFDDRLYTGYVIFDKFPNGTTEAEIEYNCGSRIGWENEYNEAGFLTYSSYDYQGDI